MTTPVQKIFDSDTAKEIGEGTQKLINHVRFGPVLTFNNKLKDIGAKAGAMKSLGDFNKGDKITKVMIIIIGCIFFIISLWCLNKLKLNKSNCKKIEKVYNDFPFISSITKSNPIYQHKVRDFYIKTAFNCCASGNFKNDFVNLCALKNCIKQGARCLDFEIYSVNNKPVISVSTKQDYSVKEAYNYVSFADAMTVISLYAFSGNTCPNPNDPLFLHFRIMSNNSPIYEQMATILYNTLEEQLLGKNFSYENDGKNIGAYPLSWLMGNVIIMVDKANPLYMSTSLYEYVNIASSGPFLRNLRFNDVKFTPDTKELINYNKESMTICIPDLSAKNKNYSADLAMSFGCQMVGMCFQNFDPYMERYTNMFDDTGSAFILRDEMYRYIPIFIELPEAQNPDFSYESREFKTLPGVPGGNT